MNKERQRERDDPPDEVPEVGSYGRVWMRWDPTKGSSQLSLKAMAVLYDAGRPLTRDELAERLLPQLDAYARSYLEAWWLRKRDQSRAQRERAYQKRRLLEDGLPSSLRQSKSRVAVTPLIALRRWLSAVFRQRTMQGRQSVIYEHDQFRPGPRPPRVQTNDGAVVKFTPEHRQEMAQQEQADRVTGWQQAMQMEWQRIQPQLEAVVDDPSRLLVVAFLARRYAGAVKTGSHRQQVSDTTLRRICHHLLRADRPAVQRALLERILQWACEER